ncbi:FAD-dependent oxidoreductase [Variovorax sp. J22R133]|nr:FAD-dependent oxidoreductase [Variovorax sp. J22R133]MDM0116306.1 FAD-dependent oxidoreductase [Variovorax sp. J22R133]
MSTTTTPSATYRVEKIIATDVVVCGGGVAGVMAAVAAARGGASVVIIERYGFFGGNATAGAVAQFNSWQTGNGRRVVAGWPTKSLRGWPHMAVRARMRPL